MPRWETLLQALVYAAEEAGAVLQRTALSPNIRDRLDYSVAVLDPAGRLVAQAEHIPVHLGALAYAGPRLVEALSRAEPPEPGIYYATNDPYLAGTHLNDIVTAAPVYAQGEHVAWVMVKAHHVDLGGAGPGGIAGAKSLTEEGLLIEPQVAARIEKLSQELLEALTEASRTPQVVAADLHAQLAATRRAAEQVAALARRYGAPALLDAMREAIGYSSRYAARLLEELGSAKGEAEDILEGAATDYRIRARVEIDQGEARIDFTGTSPQASEPLNSTMPSTAAAVAYALRAALDPGLPVNHGFYTRVHIEAPEATLVNPRPPAPVGAYTETVQRIVDVIHRALAGIAPGRVPAASCGTMTNIALGGEGWAFYETIGCGQGATPWSDGADATHTNMTNTLNTPIEVLEATTPVRIIEYSIRQCSAGPGRYRGGNGIRRTYLLLEDAELAVAANRVRTRPWGLMGGGDAASARITLKTPGGLEEQLPPIALRKLPRGSIVTVETPGGGGYGPPRERPPEKIQEDIVEGKTGPQCLNREKS